MIVLPVPWLYGASGVGTTTVTWELFVQLTRIMRPGATLSMPLSATAGDGGVGLEPIIEATLQALAGSYAVWGLAVTKARPATAADVAVAHSTWGKRPGAGVQRPAWLVGAKSVAPAPPGVTFVQDQRAAAA